MSLYTWQEMLGWLAFQFPLFEMLIKGRSDILVRDGKPLTGTMKSHQISRSDLMEEVRLNGQVSDVEEVQTATLERNGEISVVSRK